MKCADWFISETFAVYKIAEGAFVAEYMYLNLPDLVICGPLMYATALQDVKLS
jgi:hypothetical protein